MRTAIVGLGAGVVVALASGCGPQGAPQPAAGHDVVIRGGLIVDGRGGAPAVGDLAIDGDAITAVGRLDGARGRKEIDATGLAVAPGFINLLSHSEVSLIADGRSQGELRQGVTVEVFGESSMGPVDDRMKRRMTAQQADIKFEIAWDTLGGYLTWLERRGIATNVASFVVSAPAPCAST